MKGRFSETISLGFVVLIMGALFCIAVVCCVPSILWNCATGKRQKGIEL
jgi:hypothetical protein